MSDFLATQPTTENYWRGVVLLGRNVASYKLALAKSLLELAAAGKTFVTLEDLAVPYTQHLTEHLKKAEKQITSASSRFLNICRDFNAGKVTQTKLVDGAVSLGFNNVIDAFHVVNDGLIPQQFFVDERKTKRGITLTDSLLNLSGSVQAANLPIEVEARWRLIETAWSLALPPSLLVVQYDPSMETLFVETRELRVGVTGCRDALNGYHKGKCFYCFKDVVVTAGADCSVDVDHFFPVALAQYAEFSTLNLNGVWNLVLACPECNRGAGGKFMRVPTIDYLARLHRRNQFFIESHHPLRETLMNQTGTTEPIRRDFLQQVHKLATERLLHPWRCQNEQATAY